MSHKIEWRQTHVNVVRHLAQALTPWHYKQLYHETAVRDARAIYSDKTDPIEKFRQHYAEQNHSDVAFIPGGYMALRRWFPDKNQLKLFGPHNWKIIRGDCLVSFEAGYELANREPYMRDWFRDAKTISRQERRRRGFLTEAHVRHFFEMNYPSFYVRPSNFQKYARPAGDDFSLHFDGRSLAIDVKSWTKRDDPRKACIRSPKDAMVYLFADWTKDEDVVMCGMSSGEWVKIIGQCEGALTWIQERDIFTIEILLVLLNMTQMDIDYHKAFSQLKIPVHIQEGQHGQSLAH